jgi:hypothetical protein
MTAGGDEENDPILRGMRSVWLEMRDEEPPARGMMELMAAARDQASAMKPAEEVPWWRRAFAMMVRPPMLAAATVVVLIGGAVVLKGRGSDEAAMPTSSTFAQEQKPGMAEGIAKKQADSEAETPPTTGTPDPAVVAPVEVSPGYGSGTVVRQAPTPVPRARPTVEPRAAYKPPPKDTKVEEQKKEEPDAVKDRSDKAPARVQQRPSGLEIANEGDVGGMKAPDDQPTDTTSVRAPRQAPAKKVESTPGRREVSTDQLVKQTETAASRGDCAAVRVTAERIKKLDANTYKRIATQPAIARCLK